MSPATLYAASCTAEASARVARRRLHPHVLERAPLVDHRVGHAVEGDAAGHGEVAVAGPGVQPADQLEQDLLEPELDAGRQVGVLAGPLLVLAAPLGQGVELDRGDGEAAVAGGPDGLAQLADAGRPAVGGQGHDLVLVRGAAEPQVVGDLLVQQAQGVGEPLGGQDVEVAVHRPPGQVGGGLAAAVQHQHAGVAEGGGQVGRGGPDALRPDVGRGQLALGEVDRVLLDDAVGEHHDDQGGALGDAHDLHRAHGGLR